MWLIPQISFLIFHPSLGQFIRIQPSWAHFILVKPSLAQQHFEEGQLGSPALAADAQSLARTVALTLNSNGGRSGE